MVKFYFLLYDFLLYDFLLFDFLLYDFLLFPKTFILYDFILYNFLVNFLSAKLFVRLCILVLGNDLGNLRNSASAFRFLIEPRLFIRPARV